MAGTKQNGRLAVFLSLASDQISNPVRGTLNRSLSQLNRHYNRKTTLCIVFCHKKCFCHMTDNRKLREQVSFFPVDFRKPNRNYVRATATETPSTQQGPQPHISFQQAKYKNHKTARNRWRTKSHVNTC